MPKAQGALEYLIIIAASLAVVAIIAFFAYGAFGVQKESFSTSSCKKAASQCKLLKATSPDNPCKACESECGDLATGEELFEGAITCCKLGLFEEIYEGTEKCPNLCISHDQCTDPIEKCCLNDMCSEPACTSDSQCPSSECGVGVCSQAGTCDAYCTADGLDCGPGKTCCPGQGCKEIECSSDSDCSELTPPNCHQYVCTNEQNPCDASCDLERIEGCCDEDNPCPQDYLCYNGQCILIGKKNMELYSQKETFLISDNNWKDILPLVPVTTWTGMESDCQRGTGTPSDVCVYPTLIFHQEDMAFDADSIIYFMQKYKPDHLTIIGQTPQELDNLLITAPGLGAGLQSSQIQRKQPEDYLNYWARPNVVVYVEDDYGLALLASTYASLINAPLIIRGTFMDVPQTFSGRKVICVGPVTPVDTICSENYGEVSLRAKYISMTNTDKIILTNPADLDIFVKDFLAPTKSTKPLMYLYSKTSLISPFLASAKHEIIFASYFQNKTGKCGFSNTVCKTDADCTEKYCSFTKIFCKDDSDCLYPETHCLSDSCSLFGGSYIEHNKTLQKLIRSEIPYLINNDKGIKQYNLGSPPYTIFHKSLSSGKTTALYSRLTSKPSNMLIDENKLYWGDGTKLQIYNVVTGSKNNINLGIIRGNYDVSGNNVVFMNITNDKCNLWRYNLESKQLSMVSECKLTYNDIVNYKSKLSINGDYIAWLDAASGTCHFSEDLVCDISEECTNKFCVNSKTPCNSNDDCITSDFCIGDYCELTNILNLYDLSSNQKKTISNPRYGVVKIKISENKVFWSTYGSHIETYDVNTEKTTLVPSPDIYTPVWFDIHYDGIFYLFGGFDGYYHIYFYNTTSKETNLISDTVFFNNLFEVKPDTFENKLIYMKHGENTFCRYSDMSCELISSAPLGWIYGSCNPSIFKNYCTPTNSYLYDSATKSENLVITNKKIEQPILGSDSIFYTMADDEYYLYGFLTIIGSPAAIQIREFDYVWNYHNFYSAVDPSIYADLYIGDKVPDISVGRIQGISMSDVSSYLGRDLFFDSFTRTNSIEMLASSFDFAIADASNWTKTFLNTGYNAHCSIIPTSTSSGLSQPIYCDISTQPLDSTSDPTWPVLWKNKELIHYMDHGGSGYAGISYSDIPYLRNSIIINMGCSVCSTYDARSFCNNVIRQGGLGHVGAVSIAWCNDMYRQIMNKIYYNRLTLGQSFSGSYYFEGTHRMETLLGDPTIELNPKYTLEEELV